MPVHLVAQRSPCRGSDGEVRAEKRRMPKSCSHAQEVSTEVHSRRDAAGEPRTVDEVRTSGDC